MYLRHTTVRRKDKTHTYWTLVRSVRQGSKVRQETVAHLGKLDAKGRKKATRLARHFLGEQADQPELFENTRELTPAQVKVGKVRVERARAFGGVWLGWTLWRALELDAFCERHLPRGKEAISWSQIASILVIARLCEPSSELHIAESWYRRTALENLLGVPAEKVHHTRLYQGLDRLLEHKRARGPHQGPLRWSVRLGLRPSALRRHLHLLRRRSQGQPDGQARLQPGLEARLSRSASV